MLKFGSIVFKFEVMQFPLHLVLLREMQFSTKIRGL
jgi:hypothetical protein